MRNNLTEVIQKLVSSGYTINHVFDVGANKGRWTAQYRRVLPNAHFYMFEANPSQPVPKLSPKDKWFNVALSAPDITEVSFYSINGTGDSYYQEQTAAYDNCKPLRLSTTTLDNIVQLHNLPSPQLLKMDTQGAELDIIRGAAKTIQSVDIVTMEVAILPYNKGAPSFDDYVNTMSNLDFVPVGVDEIHVVNNLLVQLDVVFLRSSIKNKYYGNTFFTKIKR